MSDELKKQWNKEAERKVEKLKALILLTYPEFSHMVMNDITVKQWQEYLKEFPEDI